MARGTALKECVERSLKQAALWNEVKDRLSEPAGNCRVGSSSGCASPARWPLNQRCCSWTSRPPHSTPISTFQVEELINQLKSDYPVIVVTHNMQQAGRVADRTVFFLLGRIVEEGETSALFSHPQKKETEEYVTGRFG